jgi:hypothetical protein
MLGDHVSLQDPQSRTPERSRHFYIGSLENREGLSPHSLSGLGPVGYRDCYDLGVERGTHDSRVAEEKIFKYRRNVFLLVSSFNKDAQRFYRSRGYEVVGEIRDALVRERAKL